MTSTSPPAPRRAAVAFVLITVFLDVLAIGLVIPVLPKLVEQFRAGDTASAATVFGVMSAAWALMQFVFSPIFGALSDRFGRRPVFLLSNLGLGLDYILMALAPTLAWLFVGRIISGIAAATFSTATAYIADVTPADKRAAAFGLIGAAFGVGFIIGPVVGGLLGAHDPRLPFWVAAGLSLTNALYGFFVLPESLKPENRSAYTWRRASPIGALQFLRSDAVLLGLSSALFLHHLAHAVLPALAVLFMGYRFGFGPREVGFVLAGVGVASIIVQGGLTGPIVKWLGARRAMIAGLAAGALGLTIYGLATTPWMFCLGIPVAALWGISTSAAQQIMTARVGADAQGKLQGAGSSLMAIGNLIGPILFTQVFAASVTAGAVLPFAGSAFLLAGALLAAAAIIAARVTQPA